MSHDLEVVAHKIARQMASLSDSQVPKDAQGMAMFMGLGLALGFCYQQATGNLFQSKKPQEILIWALGLKPPERRIISQ